MAQPRVGLRMTLSGGRLPGPRVIETVEQGKKYFTPLRPTVSALNKFVSTAPLNKRVLGGSPLFGQLSAAIWAVASERLGSAAEQELSAKGEDEADMALAELGLGAGETPKRRRKDRLDTRRKAWATMPKTLQVTFPSPLGEQGVWTFTALTPAQKSHPPMIEATAVNFAHLRALWVREGVPGSEEKARPPRSPASLGPYRQRRNGKYVVTRGDIPKPAGSSSPGPRRRASVVLGLASPPKAQRRQRALDFAFADCAAASAFADLAAEDAIQERAAARQRKGRSSAALKVAKHLVKRARIEATRVADQAEDGEFLDRLLDAAF